jgi:WD40 repeat protein
VASRKELRTLTGHGNRVWSVAFSPDGTRLVSGGDDTTIRIWDVTTGEELHTWWWHKSSIFHVACRRDSKTGRDYLAVASDDETVSIWELPKE